MAWLVCLCLALSVTVAALSAKIILMRRSADEIREELGEKLEGDTNTLITISSRDGAMSRLASDLNGQLGELRWQRHRYVEGDKELKRAVTNISHDLRTPLTAIGGYLDLLEQTEVSGEAARYLGIIRNRAEALEQLTEELFGYSVLTSPEYDCRTEPVVVNGVLEESISGFYAALRERGITPEIRMTEQRVVRCVNRAALSRVFSNLISNALKYSSGDLQIELTAAGEVFFSNTAPGLSEVEVGRLFDRFYTVENARTSTGLGLSIAKVLVGQMGGALLADYEAGRLTLCVRLPEGAAK